MGALPLMLLVMLLSSCTTTRIEYVQTPSVPIPAHLLNDCLPEYIPQKFTWGDSLLLNESLLTVIEQCNLDKKAIREIEAERKNSEVP
ncbi:Rz1-like lysis system protein LysC [Providencia manganoxydans]|uniref:Rz1-like lysis system protein LysC n=2 Tax=Providencia manganoxydans TaxID=2923283 RepID=UPI003F6906E3